MRHLKLMPDYFCSPLWDVDDRTNVDQGALPLSDALRVRLEAWADTFDATLNIDDPGSSPGFGSEAAQQSFDDAGRRLWRDIAVELGPDYSVSYYSVVLPELLPLTATR